MHDIGLAVILGLVGSLAAAGLSIGLVLVAMPGAMLAYRTPGQPQSVRRNQIGLLVAAAIQSYLALAWVAFVVALAHAWTVGDHGIGKWILWVVAFWVATAPADYALASAARWKERLKAVQVVAVLAFRWTATVAPIAFFVFTFAPATRTLAWSWVPTFSTVADRGDVSDHAADRAHLTRAFVAFDSVSTLVAIPDGQAIAPSSAATESLTYRQLELGLAAGDSVSDAYLDWLHPAMREQFRMKYLAGNRLYLEGLRSRDGARQLAGIRAIQEWRGFWHDHGDQITDRALPQ